MSSSKQSNKGEGGVNIRRCHDPELIASILRRDYFDDPIPHLSHRVIQTFAREWVAKRREAYLLTAEMDNHYAGFVFGQTLGPRFWRLFASEHPKLLPELVWATLKMKYAGKLKFGFQQLPFNGAESDALEAQIAALKIPTLPRKFTWDSPGSGTGIIPLVFVHPDFRGTGLAPYLLNRITEEMFRDGSKCVEAHIDLPNLSSVRAFLKAGFEVYRMVTNDFWARKAVPAKIVHTIT
jgi:GNAT superfamily N-acetyltransferase